MKRESLYCNGLWEYLQLAEDNCTSTPSLGKEAGREREYRKSRALEKKVHVDLCAIWE